MIGLSIRNWRVNDNIQILNEVLTGIYLVHNLEGFLQMNMQFISCEFFNMYDTVRPVRAQ